MAVTFGSLGQPALLHDGNNQIGFPRNPLRTAASGKPTFRAVFPDVVPGNNKYMWLLFNQNTTFDMVVKRIYVIHDNISAVTGVLNKFSLLRVSAFTSGTPITPVADDPDTDTLPASMSADTGSSAVSDGSVLMPGIFATAEEMVLAATAFQLNRANLEGQKIYEAKDGERGLVLSQATAANRGLALKDLTNDTAGSMSFVVVFTVEKTDGSAS